MRCMICGKEQELSNSWRSAGGSPADVEEQEELREAGLIKFQLNPDKFPEGEI